MIRPLLALLFLAAPLCAALIPAANQVTWTPGVYVGVPTNIPSATWNELPITGLDTNGVTDCTATVQAWLNTNYVAPTALKLPAGTLRFTGQLSFGASKSNLVLRGAGMSNTVVNAVSASSAYFLTLGSLSIGTGTTVTDGTTKGSSNILVTSAAGFSVGKLAVFTPRNTTNSADQVFTNDLVLHVSGFDGMQRQVVLITGKSGTNLTFWPPLYDDFTSPPRQQNITPLNTISAFVGLEDFTLNVTNSATAIPVLWDCTYGSWVKGVKVRYALGFNLYGQWSLFSEVRNCYIDTRRGSGSNGAGIIFDTVCGFLIEDNIIYRQFPSVEMNFGSSGGVIGYNYLFDSTDYGSGQSGPSLDINHGPHNTSNLSEGNIAANYMSDGYYGGESRNNAYRNWFRGTQPTTSGIFAVNLKRFSRQTSLIANVIGEGSGNSFVYFGQPNIGNFNDNGLFAPDWADWGLWPGPAGFQERDTNVVRSTYLKLNYYTGTNGVPVAQQTGDTLVDSLYLTSTPSWFGTLPFPAIGPDVSQTWTSTATIPNIAIIPAQARYYGLDYLTPPTPPSTNNGGVVGGQVKLRGGINLRVSP